MELHSWAFAALNVVCLVFPQYTCKSLSSIVIPFGVAISLTLLEFSRSDLDVENRSKLTIDRGPLAFASILSYSDFPLYFVR